MTELISWLQSDPDAKVRAAVLDALSHFDTGTAAEWSGPSTTRCAGWCGTTPNLAVRRAALSQLVATVPREVEVQLVDILLSDFDLPIQLLCVDGLRGTGREGQYRSPDSLRAYVHPERPGPGCWTPCGGRKHWPGCCLPGMISN